MFVDATFDVVPAPLYQFLIVMVFHQRYKIFVPVAYILMTGKTNECCWQAFNWLSSAAQDLSPAFIGVDFEMAFFRQVSIHFPEALLIGCIFHWIQAMWKEGVKLSIPVNELKYAMREIKLLTVLPKEDVHPRGSVQPTLLERYLIFLSSLWQRHR
jgi:hypothetical protein